MIKLFALALLMGLVGFAAYVRVARIDPGDYHVDPVTADVPKVPGHALIRPGGPNEPPIYTISTGELAEKLEAVITQTPRTRLLEGSLNDGFASYVIRSALWGFPDIANVKVIDLGEGRSTFAILSRLRIGQMDFGVNEARVASWMSQL